MTEINSGKIGKCSQATPDNIEALERQIKSNPAQAHNLTETALSCWGKDAMNAMFKQMNKEDPRYQLTQDWDKSRNVTEVDFGQTNIYGPYSFQRE